MRKKLVASSKFFPQTLQNGTQISSFADGIVDRPSLADDSSISDVIAAQTFTHTPDIAGGLTFLQSNWLKKCRKI